MVLAHNIDEGTRTQDVQINEDITFESILLTHNTLSGLNKAGFYKPSPIQLHGIPLGKCGFDLLLEAKSGTGKTAVFTVLALEKLDIQKGLQVIMLAPTREIAAQICHVIKEIGSDYSGLNVEVVMGGLPVQEDVSKFKSKLVHILVGSPGRLKHLIQDKHIDVSAVRLLVLDECDKLVEKSFITDIDAIFAMLPKQKQVIMSSATYPEKCKTLISKYVHNPQHICPDSSTVLLGIAQKVTVVKYNNNIVKQTYNRYVELLKILTTKQFKQCLIFCNYQVRVAELHKMLTKEKWPAELLYGQQEQNERLDALRTLQEYKCRILISTDLAARGIDASNIDLIINFEPPLEWQTYLHRIGRAGRYGSFGTAISILSEGKEVTKFKQLFETINLKLHLRDLWTDDEFGNYINNNPLKTTVTHERHITTQETEITQDKINEQLWNILSFEREKHTKAFQSFDELQKSYENIHFSLNNNIESFTDLLTSFEKSDDVGKKVETTYICSQDINKTNKKTELTNIAHFNNKHNITGFNASSVGSTQDIGNKKLKANSIQPNKDMSDESHSKLPSITEKHKMNSQYNKVNNCMHKDSYDNVQGYVKALEESGLPTSFGKKMQPRHKPNIDNNKPKIVTMFSIPINKPSMNKIVPKSYCNTTSHGNSYKNGQNYGYKYEKNCDNYHNWFNHIKIHTKFIEYMIYCDEMSKW